MIQRYSSRRTKLHHTVLKERLKHAVSYDRIAGYFTSGILEVAGEELAQKGLKVRVVCNSDLDPRDVQTAQAARNAQRKSWTGKIDPLIEQMSQTRFFKLHELLRSGQLEVKILPNEVFGLMHGKAGVITYGNGDRRCFMGSVNESINAWKLNYELLWEDSSTEGIDWVQEEFNALWNHPYAVPLAESVIKDVERLAKRTVVTLEDWKKDSEPATAVLEEPVYRKELGLWGHQKYFVHKVFTDYIEGRKARYVLADMVGLGKTIQLALAAKLIALHSKGSVLIIAPKTLLYQWQKEMQYLLDMPSAVWNGRQWIDENESKYPVEGVKGILKCPRRVGIVSQGLFTAQSETAEKLLQKRFDTVVVDECHRARRRKIYKGCERERPDPNNLMDALLKISTNCSHMLMGTATPVQLHPVEAYDLLFILAQGDDAVLGGAYSNWRRDVSEALSIAKTDYSNLKTGEDFWEWLRDPLPVDDPFWEEDLTLKHFFKQVREDIEVKPGQITINSADYSKIKRSRQRKFRESGIDLIEHYNPFISRIIRRTRKFLEDTVNPETQEPYLPKISVKLFGEKDDEALLLPAYLEDSYKIAEAFTRELGNRVKASGFFKMLLLKRVGSSMEAGLRTAQNLLQSADDLSQEDEAWDENDDLPENVLPDSKIDDIEPQAKNIKSNDFNQLTPNERLYLQQLISKLEDHKNSDPKYSKLVDILFRENWVQYGTIIFSQYFDTVRYMAHRLSQDKPDAIIGQYVGTGRSGIWENGQFTPKDKETLKALVQNGVIKILFGTEAASEGLNLQRLGTLVNLDLPWNPTKLEQRKGRIQRIGQLRDEVWIYNMRYKDSVEDRIHDLLSERLEQIHQVFGQIPDVLEDAWIKAAEGDIEQAKRLIDQVPTEHPFELKYHKMHHIPWEKVSDVLYAQDKRAYFLESW